MLLFINLMLGAFGGITPTCAKWAATLTSQDDFHIPGFGFYVGILLYFFLGALGAYIWRKDTDSHRDYFIRGVAAPAILAGALSGTMSSPQNAAIAHEIHEQAKLSSIGLISRTFASPPPAKSTWVLSGDNSGPKDDERYLVINESFSPLSILPPDGKMNVFIVGSDGSRQLLTTATFGLRQIKTLAPKKPFNLEMVFEYDGNILKRTIHAEERQDLSQIFLSLEVVIHTRPSFIGDFLWALGANRQGKVRNIEASFNYDF